MAATLEGSTALVTEATLESAARSHCSSPHSTRRWWCTDAARSAAPKPCRRSKFGATAETDDAFFDEHVNLNLRAPYILVQQLVLAIRLYR